MPTTVQQQILSEDIREIISYRPHWVIRKGNTIFLLVLLLLLSIACLISYPDIVKASVRLVARSGPKAVAAKKEGRLEKLFVKNGDAVTRGQPLAYIRDAGQYEEVRRLQEWIRKAEPIAATGSIDSLDAYPLPLLLDLGDLQAAYQDFQSGLSETMQVLSGGYYQQKKQALLRDIQYQASLRHHLEQQQVLEEKDYQLMKTEHDAKAQLAAEKVIAPLELNQDKSRLISKAQSLEQMSSQLISSDLTAHNKSKELLDLQKFVADQRQVFRSLLLKLKSSVEAWLLQHILYAPEDGIAEFTSFLQENQPVAAGQELVYVQTSGDSGYYAEMKAGQNSFGKIKKGQVVQIRMESYPSAEFGYLRGEISYISRMPNQRDSFLVRVELPDGLKTNYSSVVEFRNNLIAEGQIITDNRKLIRRLFAGLSFLSR